jgi:ribosomal protein L11 methyltransferase
VTPARAPDRAVRVSPPLTQAELAADLLWQAGAVAIEQRAGAPGRGDVVLVAGPAPGGDPAALLAAVAGRWPAELVAVDLDAALDAWREHARPVVVGERLVVRPPWVEAPTGRDRGEGGVDLVIDLVIDPGRSFGSGAHPSTRLVLAALAESVGGGERVLDVGCGSGVLAVAALVLGASTAVGVDIDPAAVVATRANAARNGVADRLSVADGVGEVTGAYDLVVANMLLSELVAVAPTVGGAVASAGTVVLSGLLVGQRGDVLAAYRAVGLAPVASASDEGWLALTLQAG